MMDHNGIVVNQPESQSSDSKLFLRWEIYDLLFNVDIVNHLLKDSGRVI